jgi:hypothetical protein
MILLANSRMSFRKLPQSRVAGTSPLSSREALDPFLYCFTSSTRRFLARPSSLSFDATGA